MTTTSTPIRTDPTRSGAVWVTGTGAFLLLAAAAVFTAVRWDDIPAPAKLAALGLATGGFLLTGRRLTPTLPATGATLFHLGTFLVPIDVAALGVYAEHSWPTLLLEQGLAATVTFAWAATVERSVVLRWAWGAAVVVLACGIGATTPAPPVVVLAACAAVAAARRAHLPALAWAAVVGLAPVATLVDRELTVGSGTFERLGLAPGDRAWVAALAAIVAAATIGVIAQRRNQVDLALAAAVVGLAGVASAWFGGDPGTGSTAVALAATFVIVELVALALRDDPFWQPPSAVLTGVAEWAAAGGLGLIALTVVPAQIWSHTDRPLAAAAALLALGWILADGRHGEAGLGWGTSAVSVSALASVSLATGSEVGLAGALAIVAGAAVLADRRDATLVAAVAACSAPLVAWGHPMAAVAGLLGAFAVGECAVRRSRDVAVAPRTPRMVEDAAQGLTLLALVPIGLGMLATVSHTDHGVVTLVAGAVASTLLAAWIDRGLPAAGLPLGTLARAGSAAVLAGTAGFSPSQVAIVGTAVAALSLGDALRLRQPVVALGASLALPVALGAFVRSNGMSLPQTGVALTVGAVVLAGLGSLLGRTWLIPTGVAVALSLIGGLALAQAEPVALAHAVLITGAVGLAGGTVLGRADLQLAAAGVATYGFWMRLGAEHVVAAEPYLVPVVAVLVIAGARGLARGTASSWVAFGPAIALLGGAAFVERIGGGAGWHAVVAGATGVVAVAVGGERRLAGPLVLGTALLVALVGYESLAITAGLPTWTWLAFGGSTLLGAGVAMERHEVGPLETGRRLVDVVAERYR